MIIAIIVLSILVVLNLVVTAFLVMRYGTVYMDLVQTRTDFAVIERLLTPFIEWIAEVNKKRADMERIDNEKREALAKQKKE